MERGLAFRGSWGTRGYYTAAFSEIADWVADRGAIFLRNVGGGPISADPKRACPYVGENRELDLRFRAKWHQEFADPIASAPTVQLQIVRLRSDVIARRKWDFRAIDVSSAYLRSGRLELDTYFQLPKSAGEVNASWGLLKPLY